MRLEIPGRPHFGYCTNIHAGETWPEIDGSLQRYLPAIKAQIAPDQAMGIGLRLSAIAAEELASAEALQCFRSFLTANDLYVFTVNAFPYGPFHGQRVKEQVYEPDWRTPERLAYTKRVAGILAELTPSGFESSISTVPGGFKARITQPDDIAQVTQSLVRCAAYLHAIARDTGRVISLAIEPEPACFLETTREAIAYFRDHLFARDACQLFASLAQTSAADAESALRLHLGLCLDVCHSAVEFETAREILAEVDAAGIRIPKLQLSSALRAQAVDAGIAEQLMAFNDGIYLHQTVQQRDGELTRYTDLPDAVAAARRGEAGGEWRVHCHVPVFLDRFGELQSTQDTLRDVLAICRERAVSPHLEVETYTWGVLPPHMREASLGDDIVRELQWVRSELHA